MSVESGTRNSEWLQMKHYFGAFALLLSASSKVLVVHSRQNRKKKANLVLVKELYEVVHLAVSSSGGQLEFTSYTSAKERICLFVRLIRAELLATSMYTH